MPGKASNMFQTGKSGKAGMPAFLDDDEDDEDDFIPKIKAPTSKPMPSLPKSIPPPLPSIGKPSSKLPLPLPKAGPIMAPPKKSVTMWEGDNDEDEEDTGFLRKSAQPPLPSVPLQAKKPVNKFFGNDDDDEEEETFNIGKKPLSKLAMPIP